jgi:23S rRNA (uracil1939-C5)-methyltransferase
MRVTIEKLVYGGAGLARTDQGIVFVPRTAPGDVVEVELVSRKADYATARMTSLLEASPDRQTPTCPNYQTAGCCHWQHLQYPRQLAIKEAIVRETLQRTGHIRWDGPIPIVSGPDLHYRLRASFHVYNHHAGFVEERSHTVVPILECSSLVPELNEFIPSANGILARPEMAGVREVHVVSGPPVLATFGRTSVGEGPARIDVNGCVFDLHPEAFFQSNRFLLEPFMREVVQSASVAPRVLDLFCGSGFFTIPLSKQGGEVLGVESSRSAIRQARLNAKLNNVQNVEFYEGSVEETLRKSPEVRPNVVVMNPPREGAGKDVAGLVAGLGPEKIVYASCNPSTFAREAAVLMGRGYELKSVTMVDQFPNTYHIELVAVLYHHRDTEVTERT